MLEETPDRLIDRDNAVEQILSEVWEKHPQVLSACLWEAGDEDSVTVEVRVHLKGVNSTLPDDVALELQYALNGIFGEDLYISPRKPHRSQFIAKPVGEVTPEDLQVLRDAYDGPAARLDPSDVKHVIEQHRDVFGFNPFSRGESIIETMQNAIDANPLPDPNQLLLEAANDDGEVFVVDSIDPQAAAGDLYNTAAKERFNKPYHQLDGPQRREVKDIVFAAVYGHRTPEVAHVDTANTAFSCKCPSCNVTLRPCCVCGTMTNVESRHVVTNEWCPICPNCD